MKYDDPKLIEWLNTHKYSDVCDFLTCEYCNKPIKRTKHSLIRYLAPSKMNKRVNSKIGYICCNSTCISKLYCKGKEPIECYCTNCNKLITKKPSEIKKSTSGHMFCSSSCAATYNNEHKTTGTRRAKLEVYLEQKLIEIYPNLDLTFNKKDAINSELDIYIPSLKLAFELNGIFHYEPIYGSETLQSIQNNDSRKFQACLEHSIELCIIDTCQQQRFTEKSSEKYLDIINNIIKLKLTK